MIKLTKVDFIDIIHNGAVASTNFGVGKLIPCLILNISEAQDLKLLFKSFSQDSVTDSKVQWGRPLFEKDIIFLKVSYKQPVETEFHIRFYIEKHGILIDMIMQNKSVIIMEGEEGDSVSAKLASSGGKIVVEVPELNYRKRWNRIWRKSIFKKFRKKGFSREKAKKLTESSIEEMRNFNKKVQVS